MPTRRKSAPDPELQPGFWGESEAPIAPAEERPRGKRAEPQGTLIDEPSSSAAPLSATPLPPPPVTPPVSAAAPAVTTRAPDTNTPFASYRPGAISTPTGPTPPLDPPRSPRAGDLAARFATPIRTPRPKAPAAPVVPDGPRWISASPHDRHVWRRLRALPPTEALAREITALFPEGEGLLGDLFTALYRADIRWEEQQPGGGASIHGPILEGLNASRGIGRIRGGVRGDDRLALLAVDAIARRIAERIDHPDFRDHLAAEGAYEEERADLLAEIERTDRLLAERAKKRPPRPGDRADEPETMAMGERKLHRESKAARLEEIDRAHRGDYERVRMQGEIRAAVASADLGDIANGAAVDLREWPRALAAWGDDPANPAALDAAASLGLFRRLAADPGLRAATELLGRMRLRGAGFHRTRTPAAPWQVSGHEAGTDLARIVPSEMVWLADPAAEIEFLRRYGESELLLLRIEERGEPSRGPLVVCVDESSSMEGSLAHHAKAISLALIGIANEDRRAAALIRFSGAGSLETVHFEPGKPDPTSTARVLGELLGGGTDFDGPLLEGLTLVRSDARYLSADLVLITDGDGKLHPDTIAAVRAARAGGGLRLWVICAGVGDDVFRDVADRTWPFARLVEGGEDLLGDLVEATHLIPDSRASQIADPSGLTATANAPTTR